MMRMMMMLLLLLLLLLGIVHTSLRVGILWL
jgi:hypothetical protein